MKKKNIFCAKYTFPKNYSKIKKNNNKNNRIILFKQDFVAYFYITTAIFHSYSFHVVYEVKFVCMPWNLKTSFRTSQPIGLCLFKIAVCKQLYNRYLIWVSFVYLNLELTGLNDNLSIRTPSLMNSCVQTVGHDLLQNFTKEIIVKIKTCFL